MNKSAEPIAWLETDSGEKLPLDGVASLGNSKAKNRYGFPKDKVCYVLAVHSPWFRLAGSG